MKTAFKFLVAALLVLNPAVGYSQGAVKVGFLRFVAAIAPGTGPMEVKIDGTVINPDGYNQGDVTGGVSVPVGAHEVTIKREGNTPGTTKVSVAVDETVIMIPFAERVPATDSEPAHWAIRILRLKQLEAPAERGATFLSVSQNPELKVEMENMKQEWVPVFVKRLSTTQAPITHTRGYVRLRIGEGMLDSIPIGEAGNYVVLLYDDPDGKTKALNFHDQKFLSAD